MEKRSAHWADVLTWIQKVVDSCKTSEQVKSCEQLIRNFHRMYDIRLNRNDLTRDMESKLNDLYFEFIKLENELKRMSK